MTTPSYSELRNLYWYFVRERQLIKARRDAGRRPPWTRDPVLSEHRFTNVYRVDDRVSQYLVSRVLYNREWSAENHVFRAILFRMFNLPSTWDFWLGAIGEPTLANFDADMYADALTDYWRAGNNIFNGAYLVAGIHAYSDREKHRNWLYLLRRMLDDGMPARLLATQSYHDAFYAIRRYELIGNFVGMQWLTDINYSPALSFDENDFIIPGPGAERGLRKLGLSEDAKGVQWLADRFDEAMERRGYTFPWLGGTRRPHLIDVQNTLCEFDKYCRGAVPELTVGPAKIKQRFKPLTAFMLNDPMTYTYPPKWRVGEAE